MQALVWIFFVMVYNLWEIILFEAKKAIYK